MKYVQLTFKKLGDHWYLDVPHDDPRDLMLDPVLERYINRLDVYEEGIVERISLIEQDGFIDPEGMIQFTEEDLLRYFTTNDYFMMTVFINNHPFKISSKLYTSLELKYHLDLHIAIYRIAIT